MRLYIFSSLFLVIILFSCNDKKSNDINIKEDNYHTNSNYKYNYRTGTTGNYEYDYDVVGSDEYGNTINGNVNTSGKYGSGTLINAEGDEVDVDTEWTDWGIMEATDEYGNTYELEVE